MLIDFKNGTTSLIIRVKLRDSTSASGAGLTGLTNASTGLKIAAIADNEAATTSYTVAGATIDTITTLGTYAAPTATHCRFKEIDASAHPGLYELQFENSRFAVAGAKSLVVSISGATNLAQCDVCIPLRTVDPYSSSFGITGLAGLTTPTAGALITDAYVTEPTGSETFLQTLRIIRAVLAGKATDSAGTAVFKRADGTTTSLTVAHDGSGNRSSSTPGTN